MCGVCAGVRKCAKVYTGMCGCAWVDAGVCGCGCEGGCVLVCACVWDEFSEFLLENRVPTSADFNTYPIRIFKLSQDQKFVPDSITLSFQYRESFLFLKIHSVMQFIRIV